MDQDQLLNDTDSDLSQWCDYSGFAVNVLTKKSSEGDGRRKGSKVDEDDRRQHLRVQCIFEVTKVILVAAFYVFDHSPKRIAGTGQWILPWFLRSSWG